MEEFMFKAELEKLQAVKQATIQQVQAKMNPTSQTVARQCFDHLDAAALFLQQLGGYLASLPDEVETAVDEAAASGNIKFPRSSNG